MCFIVFINQIDCELLVNKHCWCKSVLNWWQSSLASNSTIAPVVKTSSLLYTRTMHMTWEENVTVYRRAAKGLMLPDELRATWMLRILMRLITIICRLRGSFSNHLASIARLVLVHTHSLIDARPSRDNCSRYTVQLLSIHVC